MINENVKMESKDYYLQMILLLRMARKTLSSIDCQYIEQHGNINDIIKKIDGFIKEKH